MGAKEEQKRRAKSSSKSAILPTMIVVPSKCQTAKINPTSQIKFCIFLHNFFIRQISPSQKKITNVVYTSIHTSSFNWRPQNPSPQTDCRRHSFSGSQRNRSQKWVLPCRRRFRSVVCFGCVVLVQKKKKKRKKNTTMVRLFYLQKLIRRKTCS